MSLSVAAPEIFCGGASRGQNTFLRGQKSKKLPKMADFGHFFFWLGGKWGEKPPTGGKMPPMPPPLMPPLVTLTSLATSSTDCTISTSQLSQCDLRLLCVLVSMSLLCVCIRHTFTLELDRTSSICPVKYAVTSRPNWNTVVGLQTAGECRLIFWHVISECFSFRRISSFLQRYRKTLKFRNSIVRNKNS